jgi:hypothetical protein
MKKLPIILLLVLLSSCWDLEYTGDDEPWEKSPMHWNEVYCDGKIWNILQAYHYTGTHNDTTIYTSLMLHNFDTKVDLEGNIYEPDLIWKENFFCFIGFKFTELKPDGFSYKHEQPFEICIVRFGDVDETGYNQTWTYSEIKDATLWIDAISPMFTLRAWGYFANFKKPNSKRKKDNIPFSINYTGYLTEIKEPFLGDITKMTIEDSLALHIQMSNYFNIINGKNW